uniref:Transcription factor domain-containing protein n=2 Tax=Kalmanozyma brasiliensis (strain GHG001) TaxID=1365824 RepID=V5E955_KALBG
MDSLSLADYLVKPSVYCCQTIAILCVAGHNICGSDLLTSLLAIGIKTAQTLGLHALGRTARFLEACAVQRDQVLHRAGVRSNNAGSCRLPDESPRQFAIWKKRIIDLEVGKRVWWAFTQQDYFAIPFSGCFSIVEGQYDTPLPHNCSDEDLEEGRLINREVNVLTVASKQRFTCHVAKIVCDFFEDLNKTRETPSLSLVQHHEDRLRFVTDRFKACLVPTQSASTQSTHAALPSFTTVLQHYLFISVQHKILVMHRAFLSRDVSAEERALSHSASIETARGVLHELERGLGLNVDGDDSTQLDLQSRVHGGALWTIPYHSVAAVTILALDMFQPASHPTERAKRRQEVKRALEAIGRFTRKSAIARRGCQLLSDLLAEGERYDRRPAQPRKRKAADGVDSVLKRIRLPEDEDEPQQNQQTSTPNQTRGQNTQSEPALEASWFSHFNHNSVRSDVSSAVLDGTSPDSERFGLLPTASFGYGSTNFNPLAGNSTSRAANVASFQLGEAANSLSSMFMSYNNDPSAVSTHDTSPAGTSRYGIQEAGEATRNGTTWKDDFGTPLSSENATSTLAWPTAQPSMSMEGVQAGSIAGMNLNMPQQQLAQILPALESMPDVWKLFDGTLGQSLVAFEESGF